MDGYSFFDDVRVRFAETDAQGIAHHANYVVWFEVARVAYLARFREGYRSIQADGVEVLVTDVQARFRAPAYFDDILRVHTRCVGLKGARFRFEYAVEREGTLILDGLKEISDEAAGEIGQHFGSLELNGLRSLTPAAAASLAYGVGEWSKGFVFDNRFSLNGLRSISPEVARELARYQGPLRLDGLRELTPDVAEALSAFNPPCVYDRLNLNGLRQLSPEAARKLAPFRATLCLGGLRTVSPALAEALVEVRGRLVLDGVTGLSYESAGILLSRLEVNLSPCVG